MNKVIDLMERGIIPDVAIRWGVRRLCGVRLRSLQSDSVDPASKLAQFAEELKKSPIAIATKEANSQHYEIPARFFELVLGPHRKYSCAYWSEGCASLDEAEMAALAITVERADIQDGQNILELGCGWGSLSLYLAEKYPRSKITAVSNSNSQRESIMARAKQKNLGNLQVLTRDLGNASLLGEPGVFYDRVVSVEMFEHLRNYEKFFEKVEGALAPTGKMFVHVFSHKDFAYPFQTEGEDDWMGRYFFTGGLMPAKNLFSHFQTHMKLIRTWDWDGSHYQKTSEAWLSNMDRHLVELRDVLKPVYGEQEVDRWLGRWRMFFISVAEFFGYRGGNEWGVTHYLFEKKVK